MNKDSSGYLNANTTYPIEISSVTDIICAAGEAR